MEWPIFTFFMIIIIYSFQQEPVRLKYKISYTYEEKDYVENDEVKNFPLLNDLM